LPVQEEVTQVRLIASNLASSYSLPGNGWPCTTVPPVGITYRTAGTALCPSIEARPLSIEAFANFERVNGTRENPLFDGDGGGMTHRMSVGKALRRYPR
jgi:hypothetical protein